MRTHITRTGPEDHLYSIIMRAYAHTDVCTVYSDDTIRFPQLCIKCGVAKSCPGTHTALQPPMVKESLKLNKFQFSHCNSCTYWSSVQMRKVISQSILAGVLNCPISNNADMAQFNVYCCTSEAQVLKYYPVFHSQGNPDNWVTIVLFVIKFLMFVPFFYLHQSRQ